MTHYDRVCHKCHYQYHHCGVYISIHDDVIKWKHSPHYWRFVRGIRLSPMDSPHSVQWRGPLMFYFMYAWTNSWASSPTADDFRRHGAHCHITVMSEGWLVFFIFYLGLSFASSSPNHQSMIIMPLLFRNRSHFSVSKRWVRITEAENNLCE